MFKKEKEQIPHFILISTKRTTSKKINASVFFINEIRKRSKIKIKRADNLHAFSRPEHNLRFTEKKWPWIISLINVN